MGVQNVKFDLIFRDFALIFHFHKTAQARASEKLLMLCFPGFSSSVALEVETLDSGEGTGS